MIEHLRIEESSIWIGNSKVDTEYTFTAIEISLVLMTMPPIISSICKRNDTSNYFEHV